MEKESNLSEKRTDMESFERQWYYPEEDVKEFIKLDTELINQFACGQLTLLELKQEREKLAGEELI